MLKKRNIIFLSLLILGALLLSSCFLNPPVTEGILKGQVMVPEGFTQAKDLTGQALPDATINIIDLTTGAIIATTTTDATGHYQVSVPPGGPYLLEAVKGSVKLEQITCQVEVGIEYDLGTADCVSTAAALVAQAMMDAGDNPADIDCADILADPEFDDVSSIVCSTIQAGGDPTVSALVQQAVEDFLSPSEPTPTPTYSVTFDSQGGSAVNSQTVEQGGKVIEPADPTRIGYTFGGWYKESGCTNAWDFANDTVISNITLYAKWTINTYTVTFDKNGGDTEADPTTKTAAHGGNVGTLPTEPTRTGYTFTSWNTQAGGGGTEFTETTVVTADLTVYAKWASTDATLNELTVDGTTITGFHPATLDYNKELPYGTTTVPTVGATTNNSNASKIITQATSVTGTAKVVVTAEDGTTQKTYTVTFSVVIGPLDHFTISGYPASTTSGDNFGSNNVVVTVYDGNNKIKTDYTGTVVFSSTDGSAVLPGNYIFTSGAGLDNGVYTFSGTGFTLKTAGSQTISLTDGTVSVTSNDITVNPASLDHIVILPNTASIIAGTTQAYTAEAFDTANNSLGNVTTSTTFTIDAGANGSWSTFTYTSATSGTWTVTGTYSGKTDTVSLTVISGAATQVWVETAADGSGEVVPAQNLAQGSSITVYAISRDASDNFVANVAASTWSLESITGGVVAGDLAPNADSKSAVFTGHVIGTAEIKATSDALATTNSGTLTVTAGVANKLSFTVQPSNANSEAAITPALEVTVQDTYGNTITSDTTTSVTVAIGTNPGSGTLSGTATQTVSGGVATFDDLSIDKAGTGYTLTASSDPSYTGATSEGFNITAGSITKIVFTTSSQTLNAGSVSSVMTIQTQDASGNPGNVSENTIIDLTSTSANDKFYSNVEGTTEITSITVSSGTNSANFYYQDTTVGTPTITAAEDPDQSWTDATQGETIDPGSLDHFTFVTISNQTAGTAFNITITAKDSSENTVTSFTSTAALTVNNGTISPTTTDSFVNGVLSDFSVTIPEANTEVTITATADSTGTSDSFNVNPGAAASFVVTTEHTGTETAGTSFSVTVTAKDADGNNATGYTGDKNIVWTWNATSSPNSTAPTKPGDGDKTFSSGAVTVSGFTLTNSGATPALTATEGSVAGTTSAITVNDGSLNYVKVATEASGNTAEVTTHSMTADNTFVVHAAGYDAYGNYKNDESVNWTGSDVCSGKLTPTSGISTTFTPTATGTGTITAVHSTVTDDTTGTITVRDPIVTFDKNDDAATGTMAAQTIPSGTSENLTACAFTKTGWTFAGWATTSGGAVVYNDEESYTIGTENVTLYAQWTPPTIYLLRNIGPAGGYIFYDKGSVSDGWRYLEAAPSRQSIGAPWGCYGVPITDADGTAVGTGEQNTIDIEAGCTTAGTAADICANLSLGGYNDWFLPSKDELNLMYENLFLEGVGGINSSFLYWSSSEVNSEIAFLHGFYPDGQYGSNKDTLLWVLAVRAF